MNRTSDFRAKGREKLRCLLFFWLRWKMMPTAGCLLLLEKFRNYKTDQKLVLRSTF